MTCLRLWPRDRSRTSRRRRKLRLVFLAALVAVAGFCPTAQAETFDGRHAIIIDGDTLAIGSERVRILNIDAPESFRPRCEAELVVGLRAKERLAALLRAGPVGIDRHGRDRYRRTLARLSIGGRDVGSVLIAEGLAVRWKDGRAAWEARRRRWCG